MRGKVAQRDKSQGFGFVYFELAALLGKNRAIPAAQQSIDTGSFAVPNINFPKLEARKTPEDSMNTNPAPIDSKKVHDIRDKLDRLQALHHKLHVMLEEVDKLTKKKR